MAKADVVVGVRAKSRGRVGEVVSVDEKRALVTMRFDDARAVHRNGVRDESLSEGDSVVGAAEVEVIPAPSAEEVKAERERRDEARAASKSAQKAAPAAGVKTAVATKAPTQAQITAARRAALEAGKKEGLGAAKLLDVQDEAEAELVAKVGRGLDE